MINYVGRVVQKTGETIVGLANSSLVKGASRLGTGALKMGVEGVAGVADKAIKGAQKAAPKLKEISGKKISDGIGKVVNKTMVGTSTDYKTLGQIVNNSKPGKAINNKIGKNVISDNLTPRLNGTTHVASNKTFGLVDAVTDRAKTVIDGAVDLAVGHQFNIGPLKINTGLVKTGADNYMPFGLKATGLGATVAIGASLASGTPQAIETLNRNRQGTNMDSQPVSLAPTTPAYSNNGGATGDLVFALNNLRHGGMM